jgi:Sulfotransferase domain
VRVSDNKPLAPWAVPRSISTAFERVFVEREDFEVLHEPFSASYYHSEDRLSNRYSEVEPEAERKDPALSGKLQEAYEYCLPYYYTLGAHAIPGTVRTSPPAPRIRGGRHEVHRS